MALLMKYFVLKPRSKRVNDPFAHAARRAMWAYASCIQHEDPELAHALSDWAQTEETAHNIMMQEAKDGDRS